MKLKTRFVCILFACTDLYLGEAISLIRDLERKWNHQILHRNFFNIWLADDENNHEIAVKLVSLTSNIHQSWHARVSTFSISLTTHFGHSETFLTKVRVITKKRKQTLEYLTYSCKCPKICHLHCLLSLQVRQNKLINHGLGKWCDNHIPIYSDDYGDVYSCLVIGRLGHGTFFMIAFITDEWWTMSNSENSKLNWL